MNLRAFGVGLALLASAFTLLPAQRASAEDTAVTKLRVGYIPIGIYSYFWRARDAGYFKDAKLDVELVPMAGGGQIIPALQSGSLQFGISDALGLLNARNGGIPATYVSFNFSQASSDPVHAVLTTDPNIKTAEDLKGKSVATNLSYNTDWTMMRAWLRKNGVDLKSVTFREVPFPDMLAALRNNTVAAVGASEPFVTMGKEQGARVLGYYFTDVQSPIVLSGIVALTPYIEKNKDVVRRFVQAINHAIDDYNSDPAIARKTIEANTKVPPSVIEKMGLGKWQTRVPAEQMQFWVDAAKKEGVISDTADLNTLVWQDK
ncbi:ABC transporter substrate-binding protein [Bradyrhizobium sp.]|uniref:ABC transporter substrate-binding protein n=1 Tax=Bradyrhizobium sp. TaxID=376 RepID=UPI0039E28902